MSGDTIDRLAKVIISGDRLTATLRLEPGIGDELTEDVVRGLLTGRGVDPFAADRPRRIAAAVEAYRDATERLEMVVAEGRAPVHGVDGRFELDPSLAPEQRARPRATDDGAVSFYERSAFTIVAAGQRIGRLIAPTEGQPGVDVMDGDLAARSGRPAPIRLDASVEADADGEVRSRVDGELQATGGLLRVVELLSVPEYVDFSTGNVHFPGDVVVGRGVRDCFTVRCGGDLTVRELVEAATLVVGRDAKLDRGMAAREKGSLTVGRDLDAKYLDNVHCVVGRDMQALKEVHNCHVVVGRRFIGPTCAVIGGALAVAGKAEIGQIGGESGSQTDVILGRIGDLEELARQALDLLPAVERAAEVAAERLEQMRRMAIKPTAQQTRELTELELEVEATEARLDPLRRAIEQIAESLSRHTEAELSVGKIIHAGATIWIGTHRAEFETAIKGPLRIHLSQLGAPVITDGVRGSAIPLADIAKVTTADRLDATALRRATGRAA
ncbi:MAG: DUF342 domain-containing protein [Phycisphaerales bacterium JB039]